MDTNAPETAIVPYAQNVILPLYTQWVRDGSMNRICVPVDFSNPELNAVDDVLIILRSINASVVAVLPPDFVDYYCSLFNFSKPLNSLSEKDSRSLLPILVDIQGELMEKGTELKPIPLDCLYYDQRHRMSVFRALDCSITCYHGMRDDDFRKYFSFVNVKHDVAWTKNTSGSCVVKFFKENCLPVWKKMKFFHNLDAVGVSPTNLPYPETSGKNVTCFLKRVATIDFNSNPADVYYSTSPVLPGQSGSPIFCSKTGNLLGVIGNCLFVNTPNGNSTHFLVVPRVFELDSDITAKSVQVQDGSFGDKNLFSVIDHKSLLKTRLCVKGSTGIGKTVHIPAHVFSLLKKPVVVLMPNIINTRVDFIRKTHVHLNIASWSSEEKIGEKDSFDILYCTQKYYYLCPWLRTSKYYVIMDEADSHTPDQRLILEMLIDAGHPYMLLSATLEKPDIIIEKPSPFTITDTEYNFETLEAALAQLLQAPFLKLHKKVLIILDNREKCEYYAKRYGGSYCYSGHIDLTKSPIFATSVAEKGITINDLEVVINIDFRTCFYYSDGYTKKQVMRIPTSPALKQQSRGRTGRTCAGSFINVQVNELSVRTAPPKNDFFFDMLHVRGDKSRKNLGVFLDFKSLRACVLNAGFEPYDIASRYKDGTLSLSKAESDFLMSSESMCALFKDDSIRIVVDNKDKNVLNAFQETLSRSKMSFSKAKFKTILVDVLCLYAEDVASEFAWNALAHPVTWALARQAIYYRDFTGFQEHFLGCLDLWPYSFQKHLLKYLLGDFGRFIVKFIKWERHAHLFARGLSLIQDVVLYLLYIHFFKKDLNSTPGKETLKEMIRSNLPIKVLQGDAVFSSEKSFDIGKLSLKVVVDSGIDYFYATKEATISGCGYVVSKAKQAAVVVNDLRSTVEPKISEIKHFTVDQAQKAYNLDLQTAYEGGINLVSSTCEGTKNVVLQAVEAAKTLPEFVSTKYDELVSKVKSLPRDPQPELISYVELFRKVNPGSYGFYQASFKFGTGRSTELPTNSIGDVAENCVSLAFTVVSLFRPEFKTVLTNSAFTFLKVRTLDKALELTEKYQKVRTGDSFSNKQLEALKYFMNLLPQGFSLIENMFFPIGPNWIYPSVMDVCVPLIRETHNKSFTDIYRALNQSMSLFAGRPLLFTLDYGIMTFLRFMDVTTAVETSYCSIEIVNEYRKNRKPFSISLMVNIGRLLLSFVFTGQESMALLKSSFNSAFSFFKSLFAKIYTFLYSKVRGKQVSFGSDDGMLKVAISILFVIVIFYFYKKTRDFLYYLDKSMVEEFSMPERNFYGVFSDEHVEELASKFTFEDPFDLFSIPRLPPDTSRSMKYLRTALGLRQGPNWKNPTYHFKGYVKARHPIIYPFFLNATEFGQNVKFNIQKDYDVDSMVYANTTSAGFYGGKYKRKCVTTIPLTLPISRFNEAVSIVFKNMEVDHTPMPPTSMWVQTIEEGTNLWRSANLAPFCFMTRLFPEEDVSTNGEYLDNPKATACFDAIMEMVNSNRVVSLYYEFPKLEKLPAKIFKMPVVVNDLILIEDVKTPCRVITTSFQEHKCLDAVSTLEVSVSIKKLPSFFIGRTPAQYSDQMWDLCVRFKFSFTFDLSAFDSCITPVHVFRETMTVASFVTDELKKKCIIWSGMARKERNDLCYDGTSYHCNTGRASGDMFYTTYGNTIHSSVLGADILLQNGYQESDFGVSCYHIHQGDDTVIFTAGKPLDNDLTLRVIAENGFQCKESFQQKHDEKNPAMFLSHFYIRKRVCGRYVNFMSRPLEKVLQKYLMMPQEYSDLAQLNKQGDYWNAKYIFSVSLSFGVMYFHQPEFFSLLRLTLSCLPVEVCSFIPFEKGMHFRMGKTYEKLIAEKTTLERLTPGWFVSTHRDGEDFPDFDDSYGFFMSFTPQWQGLKDYVASARKSITSRFAHSGWKGKLTFINFYSNPGWKAKTKEEQNV